MSFESLSPPPKAAKTSDPVRVANRPAGKNIGARLVVIISGELLDKVDKKKARTFAVGLGTAEDRHLLRITANADGLFQAKEVRVKGKGGGYRIVLPPHERWPLCRFKAQAATHEIAGAGDALHVTLPAWAWDARAKAEAERLAGLSPRRAA